MRRKARQAAKPENRPRFWGRHAVAAALANPERRIAKIWATREAAATFDIGGDVPVTYADAADLGRLVPGDAPHQGIVAEVERLPDIWLGDLLEGAPERRPLLVLDQVTDPHNVGAILRSAAAFDAIGIVTQDRHAPPESGALAKAASGALDDGGGPRCGVAGSRFRPHVGPGMGGGRIDHPVAMRTTRTSATRSSTRATAGTTR